MPRIAANLTLLFAEYPFLERFDRAAAAGFTAVEVQLPYGEDPHQIADRLKANNLQMVLFNLPAGDWAAGDRGIAADYDRQDEFRKGVGQAIEYAAILRPERINCLAGKADDSEKSDLALLQNVRYAAEELADNGLNMTLEPVNTKDVPGFALPTTRSAIELIAELEYTNLGLQLDVYHSLMMNEDPIEIIQDLGNEIAHIQIADVPGRHHPGSGDIDFEQLFSTIDSSGYNGWVALEYIPDGPTEDGFALMRTMGLLG